MNPGLLGSVPAFEIASAVMRTGRAAIKTVKTAAYDANAPLPRYLVSSPA